MTKIIILIFLVFTSCLNAQKALKKKYCGSYEGEIAAYKINTGSQLIDVSSTTVSVKILKKELTFKVGRNEMIVPYKWIKKDKKSIQIEFTRMTDETKEILILNKKTKEILREGLYPQPKCVLKKVKKK